MSPDDERRAARRRDWLDDLRQDVRFGMRSALRAPLFSLLTILTLALGLGANAAVFGVLKSVLLDALPYADAGRLVRVYSRQTDGSLDHLPTTTGTVTDHRERQRSFSQLAAFESATRDVVLLAESGPSVLKAEFVEPELFRVLGVRPALGRLLTLDDAASDTAYSIVLSHAAWQRQFGGSQDVLSRTVRINGISRTVVGVLPRDFVGPVSETEVFMPMDLRSRLRDPVHARRQHWLGIVGRLGAGVDVAAAQRELSAIFEGIARAYPQYSGNSALTVTPIRDDMVGDTRTPLLILMASAGLVLLITCANLTGALLSRTVSRQKEFAVRMAIGAGRGRLVRQLLTESALLGVAGGIAGLCLAWLGLRGVQALALPFLPAYAELSLDRGAMLATTAVALLTGLAFGLVPALAVGRSGQAAALREEGRSATESPRSRTLRGVLVAGQIALCLSLLTGAGLLARSLWAMMSAPLGFVPEGVLSVAVELPSGQYATGEARERFIRQFEERLRAMPGVSAVASAGEAPTQTNGRTGFLPEGRRADRESTPLALYSTISDDYFKLLGIPLRAGRAFGPEDRAGGPMTIILSEGIARRFWPRGDAVGQRVLMSPEPDAPVATVVGVVGDVRNSPAQWNAEPVLYMSNRQAPWNGPVFLLRTTSDPLDLLPSVRQALAGIDATLPIHRIHPLPTLLSSQLAGKRLPVLLMGAFGGLALLLASVGVYAMFASMAAAREREFGVRMALGASRRSIATLVLRQGGVWMGVGMVAGALGVFAVARLLRSTLTGVTPFDPIVLGTAFLVLAVAAIVALLVPVRRATRVDPVATMR